MSSLSSLYVHHRSSVPASFTISLNNRTRNMRRSDVHTKDNIPILNSATSIALHFCCHLLDSVVPDLLGRRTRFPRRRCAGRLLYLKYSLLYGAWSAGSLIRRCLRFDVLDSGNLEIFFLFRERNMGKTGELTPSSCDSFSINTDTGRLKYLKEQLQ